jgi:hypothetical protein
MRSRLQQIIPFRVFGRPGFKILNSGRLRTWAPLICDLGLFKPGSGLAQRDSEFKSIGGKMKKMKKMKKRYRARSLCSLLAAVFALSACTQGTPSMTTVAAQTPQQHSEEVPQHSKDESQPALPAPKSEDVKKLQDQIFLHWKKLVSGSAPDLPLAQLLAGTVAELAPEATNDMMKEVDSWSLSDPNLSDKIFRFKEDLAKSYSQNRLRLTLSNQNIDSDIVAHSIFALPSTNLFASDAMSALVDLSLRSHLQNKAYQSLTQTYTDAIQDATSLVAQDLVASFKRDQSVEYEHILQVIRNALLTQKEVQEQVRDILSKSSKLSACIQHIHDKIDSTEIEKIILEEVAGGVVKAITQGTSTLFIAPTLQVFEQKVDEIFVFKQTLIQEAKKFQSDLHDVQEQSQALIDSISGKKNILKDVNEKMYQAKSIAEDELKKAQDIANTAGNQLTGDLNAVVDGVKTGDWQGVLTSTQNSVNRIGNLCVGAENLASSLGIPISPDIQNAVKTVSEVSEVINIGASVAAAFATGGASAILSVVSGFSGMSQGPDLSGIESELAAIREQQKEILQNEVKIMEMVKDLADMVGQFHEEEMQQLYVIDQDIKDTASIMTMMDWGLCKKMLSSLPSGDNSSQILGLGWRQGFQSYGRFLNQNGIQKFISDSQAYYSSCQTNLGSVLSPWVEKSGADLKTSILRYTVSGEDKDSQFLEEVIYQPLFQFTLQSQRTHGLSLPMARMPILAAKYKAFSELADNDEENLQLTSLLSPQRLDIYITSYLSLRPFVQLDVSQWTSTFDSTADLSDEAQKLLQFDHFLSSQQINFAHERSVADLQATLDLIRSAIAQESILAGEPILDLLSTHFAEFFSDAESPLGKSVRSNKVLLTNLINYVFSQVVPPTSRDSYEQARTSQDTERLITILGKDIGETLRTYLVADAKNHTLLIQIPGGKSASSGPQVSLPTAHDLSEGKILYRSTMGRLVDLQSRVMDELQNLSASSLQPEEIKKLMNVLFIQSKTMRVGNEKSIL